MEQDKEAPVEKAPKEAPKGAPKKDDKGDMPTGDEDIMDLPELEMTEPDLEADSPEDDLDRDPSEPIDSDIEGAIEAVKGLQTAAASMEGAIWVAENTFSDFTMARRLGELKSEVVRLIGQARKYVKKKAAQSPEAERLVSDWLKP